MSLCLLPPNLSLFGKDLRKESGRSTAYIYSNTIKISLKKVDQPLCTLVISLIYSLMSTVKPLLMAPLVGGHLQLVDSYM